jgi:hypothetical protein
MMSGRTRRGRSESAGYVGAYDAAVLPRAGEEVMGKRCEVTMAIGKKTAVATIDRGERRDAPQRKWPLYRQYGHIT